MHEATFSDEARQFVAALDEAAQWHLGWTRAVMRCAVMRTAPGDDVLGRDAHRCCRFAQWLEGHRHDLAAVDSALLKRLEKDHRTMHGAARDLCRRVLAGEAGDPARLDAFEDAQADVVAALAQLKTAYLAQAARLDALTGLPLRYGLAHELARCRAQAQRHGESLVLLMLDLDRFKQVNDAHGHPVGDRTLVHVASVLREHCRAGEPLVRFGGEEFVALLQAADRAAAERAAQRILQALRDGPLRLPDGRVIGVRASAGLAEVADREPVESAIARADRALYAAKQAGRDTWRWAEAARQPSRDRNLTSA